MIEQRKSNTVIIGVLVAIIALMSIGFATLSANLNVTSKATVGGIWDVRITQIGKVNLTTGAVELAGNGVTNAGTTAVFNVTLAQPGDYAIFNVTVENNGTIDAKLKAITPTETGDDSLKYTITPLDNLEAGTSILSDEAPHVFQVKVEYLTTAIGDNAPQAGAEKSLTLVLDYEQA